jgi:hypothetical protein
VVFVIAGRNDLFAQTPPDQFQNQLNQVIDTIVNAGAIPVLATIPGDPAQYPALNTYNSIIVDTADRQDLPLINVWRAIAEDVPTTVQPDLTLSQPPTNDLFNPQALASYGAPVRNLEALRMLRDLLDEVVAP